MAVGRRAALLALLFILPGVRGLDGAPEPVRVLDLTGRAVDPFRLDPAARAVAFVFVSTKCPISNRYAPNVRQLATRFSARGAALWLVYPDPADSADDIRRHLAAFDYPDRALRDPEQLLVKAAGVSVTPAAAVYDSRGVRAYRGRIDDRYVSLGLERPGAAHEDLRDAVDAVLAGRPVSNPDTPAVGCFISDFTR